ncbi:MAG: formate/nitrite transporter family protein [Culicoidibacterales bacterium]
MENIPLTQKMNNAVKKKIDLVEKSPARYLLRAIMATVLLTLATVIALLVGQMFESTLLLVLPKAENTAYIAFNLGKFTFALTFGWALVMILFMNTELFTSNAMYFSGKTFDGTVKLKLALKVLIICYIGNFIGAVLSSLLFVYSGTFTEAVSSFGAHIVSAKLAKPPLTVFLQGVIANLVVNIAVVLALNLKNDFAKIASILFLVFTFAFFGSEHVIANFASFSVVGFATEFQGMSAPAILTNFFFSTLGNIVGGGALVGIVYVWLNNKPDISYLD